MKSLRYFISILTLSVVFAFVLIIGCGTDDSSTNTTTGGWPPNITIVAGTKFVYTTDTILPPPPGTPVRQHKNSTDVVQAQTTIGGQLCFPFLGTTYDSITMQTIPDLYYVRYDPAGKYYQYGIRKLIDTTQPATWDLIGDFTVTRGTS